MSFAQYLSTRRFELAVFVAAGVATCFVAHVGGVTDDLVILIALLLVAALCLALSIGYARVRRFYQDIDLLSKELEHPYQLHSLISKPDSPDLQITYEALRTMGVVSAAELAEANARFDDHRGYIETWVHEMKTPLAAAELVARKVENPAQSQLIHEFDSMERQLEQVLWYARAASPERDYAIRRFPLMHAAKRACKENARFLIEKGVSLRFPADFDPLVFTDEKQLAFIVSQAVVNAAKYGASTITFSAREIAQDNGSRVVDLSIEDDGGGMPASDVPRVFDRGFTGVRGRELGSSTGMGLYLAAQLCESLGLGLSLSSTEGEGTRVQISIPSDCRQMDLASH